MSYRFRADHNVFAGLACILLSGLTAGAESTTMINVSTTGELPSCPGTNYCYSVTPAISDDGRFVVYSSTVKNIVDGPQTDNYSPQLLLRDRLQCTTTRISQKPDGTPGNNPSGYPAISGDGEIIAFESRATNLVTAPGQSTAVSQIIVYVRATGAFELISKSAAGVAGNGSSAAVTLSSDGRYVCFQSDASNLVRGDNNQLTDIFVFDRQTQTMVRISNGMAGEEPNSANRRPSISEDGRFVAFDSSATNLTTTPTNNFNQAYLYDRDADADGVFDEPGETSLQLVSMSTSGQVANNHVFWPFVSPNGDRVAFNTNANNLVTGDTNGANDIFIRHIATNTTTRESVGPGGAQAPNSSWFPMHFSADGRYMTFHSASQGLVSETHNGFTHIFRRDLQLGVNVIVSRTDEGVLADQSNEYADVSADGSFVAFGSAGYNMVPGGSTNPDWVNQFVRSFTDAHPYDTCEATPCPADMVNSVTFQPPPDGVVNAADLAFLLGAWGPNPGSPADIVDASTFQPPPDGVVNAADLAYLLGSWGTCE